jgi:hypothetical protein
MIQLADQLSSGKTGLSADDDPKAAKTGKTGLFGLFSSRK